MKTGIKIKGYNMILGLIVTSAVGILLIVIGIINFNGNINSLHSYHRSRVKPEDVLPFGRLVGIGMIIMGVAFLVFGVLITFSSYYKNHLLSIIAYIVMGGGIVAGTSIAFYAMIKYNGGIF